MRSARATTSCSTRKSRSARGRRCSVTWPISAIASAAGCGSPNPPAASSATTRPMPCLPATIGNPTSFRRACSSWLRMPQDADPPAMMARVFDVLVPQDADGAIHLQHRQVDIGNLADPMLTKDLIQVVQRQPFLFEMLGDQASVVNQHRGCASQGGSQPPAAKNNPGYGQVHQQ